MKFYFYLLLSTLFLSSVNFASNPFSLNLNQTLLNAALAQTNCRTNFTTTILNYVISTVPSTGASLNPIITTLKQDQSQLSIYANSGNAQSLHSYQTSTYEPELHNVTHAIINSIKNANLTSSAMRQDLQNIRQQYNSTKVAYQQCSFLVTKSLAIEKLDIYNNQIDQFQQTISKLNSKGISTSSLSQMLQASNTTIILPLETSINSASNSTQIVQAMSMYCLYDGCSNGANFHLDAKFSVGVLTNILNKAISLNVSNSTLAPVKSYLGIASTNIAQVGTSQYNSTERSAIWSSITSAASFLKNALTVFKKS